ncbi:GntR family transcriptional regulator [Sinosporangium siamense]|uniref:GntR family transcriptional regulator n=1 Tax=Sinosporangium siamense TaxID=1367973 RepID=A0A919RJW5_9ACTN|nr:GntR family transcriptional regulator [Sinosporangium siamense]GII95196.1 GntR family transcriptional regulator [Sinosporangium siamense]
MSTSARSLTERVYTALRGEILAGRVTPGRKLKPSELSAAHGVSLNVVREALSRLAGERLVRALPQQGFAVVDVSVADLEDLTEVRATIEGSALRRSVERGDLAWEAALAAAHHRLAGTPMGDPERPGAVAEEWIRAHDEFHKATMAACGSPRMMEIVAGLAESAAIYRYWSRHYDEGRRDIAGEHRAIFEAVMARDADAACRLHQEHIRRTAGIVVAGVERGEG